MLDINLGNGVTLVVDNAVEELYKINKNEDFLGFVKVSKNEDAIKISNFDFFPCVKEEDKTAIYNSLFVAFYDKNISIEFKNKNANNFFENLL